ncbi:MAG: YfhO family protein [Deltaproteobacteria bacterium]|nr:YfhO family protein [Deltaproteobacteria bacterium]
MQEIDALGRGPYLEFLMYANEIPPERQYMLLGAMNVKYISSLNPLPEEGISLMNDFPEYHTWLYTMDDWVPRSYIVPKAIVEKIPSKTLDRLSEEEFNPLKEVVLDHPLELPSPRALHSRAEIVRYTNTSVTIKAALDGSGILVLTDSFSPGWKVFVNGEEKKVLRANFFFRGVALGQGQHLVEFRYEPLSFTIGLAVSLTTICGIAIWFIYVLAIRKKKAVPTV